MMDLVIFALRRVAGGLLQRRFQVLLADLFDVWVSRNGIGIESLAVESIQGITVRDQPRLHRHEHPTAGRRGVRPVRSVAAPMADPVRKHPGK